MDTVSTVLSLLEDVEQELGADLSMHKPFPPHLVDSEDQIVYATHYAKNRGTDKALISLDHYQELFAVRSHRSSSSLSALGTRLHNHFTDTLPLILHGK